MGCGNSKSTKTNNSQDLNDILKDPERMKMVRENARKQFEEADKDKSGKLDQKEFEASCRKYNKMYGFPEPSLQQIKDAMEKFDKNKDGHLSLSEYQDMIEEVLKILAKIEAK